MVARLFEAGLVATFVSLVFLFWGTRKSAFDSEEDKKSRKKTKDSVAYVWLITFAIVMVLSGFATL